MSTQKNNKRTTELYDIYFKNLTLRRKANARKTFHFEIGHIEAHKRGVEIVNNLFHSNVLPLFAARRVSKMLNISVRPSHLHCVETAEPIIKRSNRHRRPASLVFAHQTLEVLNGRCVCGKDDFAQ